MIPTEWLVAAASGDIDPETERLVLAAVLADPALRRRFLLLHAEAVDADPADEDGGGPRELGADLLDALQEIMRSIARGENQRHPGGNVSAPRTVAPPSGSVDDLPGLTGLVGNGILPDPLLSRSDPHRPPRRRRSRRIRGGGGNKDIS